MRKATVVALVAWLAVAVGCSTLSLDVDESADVTGGSARRVFYENWHVVANRFSDRLEPGGERAVLALRDAHDDPPGVDDSATAEEIVFELPRAGGLYTLPVEGVRVSGYQSASRVHNRLVRYEGALQFLEKRTDGSWDVRFDLKVWFRDTPADHLRVIRGRWSFEPYSTSPTSDQCHAMKDQVLTAAEGAGLSFWQEAVDRMARGPHAISSDDAWQAIKTGEVVEWRWPHQPERSACVFVGKTLAPRPLLVVCRFPPRGRIVIEDVRDVTSDDPLTAPYVHRVP